MVGLSAQQLGLPLLLQLVVELWKAVAVGRVEGVFVAEVQVEAQPLPEIGAVVGGDGRPVQQGVVTTGKVWGDVEHGMVSGSGYRAVFGRYLVSVR